METDHDASGFFFCAGARRGVASLPGEFFFRSCTSAQLNISSFMDELLFFACPKKGNQKKGHPTCLPT